MCFRQMVKIDIFAYKSMKAMLFFNEHLLTFISINSAAKWKPFFFSLVLYDLMICFFLEEGETNIVQI